MNRQAILILISITAVIIALNSFNLVFADEDFCYDQVGDGHFCFHQRDTCKHEQRHDGIAESPCYNKDRGG